MNRGFWDKLSRPFFVLAPMADVTDFVFRKIISKYGKPDVFWTEFVSADGLCSKGKNNLLPILKYDESMRPIVAQIFGSNPENIYKAAILIKKLGFDGIDINMGCPDKAIVKQGAGAALIKNPKLAIEIIKAAKKGAGKLPVSVKTRIGDNKDILEEWLKYLLQASPSVITIHARTRKQMSRVPANWDAVKRAVDFIKTNTKVSNRPLIIGNGDVLDLVDAKQKAKESGADGVMLGRAIFGNPWLFSLKVDYSKITLEKKIKVMLEHTKLFEKTFKGKKNFGIMKKHYKAYINNFPGAKELRNGLMKTKTASEVEAVIKSWNSETRILNES